MKDAIRKRVMDPIRQRVIGPMSRFVRDRWPAVASLSLLTLLLASLIAIEQFDPFRYQARPDSPYINPTGEGTARIPGDPTSELEAEADDAAKAAAGNGGANPGGQPKAGGDPADAGETVPTSVEAPAPPVAVAVSKGFGWAESRTYADWRYHTGLDYAAEVGTAVQAALGGEVIRAGMDELLGITVEIRHSDRVTTVYSGLQNIAVKVGDRVNRGQKIGEVGQPGVHEIADGAHLHFEYRVNDESVDPTPLFR